MIELTILHALKERLDDPVYATHRIQEGTYVVIEKTGSSEENYLMSSTFAFQSYGDTMYEALTLNMKLKKAVGSLIDLSQIAKIKLNTDYNFTDTQVKKYRYQAVFTINHY